MCVQGESGVFSKLQLQPKPITDHEGEERNDPVEQVDEDQQLVLMGARRRAERQKESVETAGARGIGSVTIAVTPAAAAATAPRSAS